MENVVITGASSGIARKVIERLKKKNYHIYVTVHTEKQLELAKERYQNDSNVTCLKLDITNNRDRKQLNNIRIDVLVCNAAIGYGGSIAEIPMDRVRDNFEVNVFSNFEVVQLVIKQMIKQNHGRIVMISSLAGLIPIPFLGTYSATKASIIMLTSSLRYELKLLDTKVKLVLIEPGMYRTGFNQVMRENKFDFMNYQSLFREELEMIKKYEPKIYRFLETDNLNSIVRKIDKAITSKHPKFLYRSRISQVIGVKLYQLFLS